MHRIDDDRLITAALLKRFLSEATLGGDDERHVAVLQRSNGDIVVHEHGGSPSLPAEQMVFAMEMLPLLNREAGHDGAWTMVFTNPEPEPDLIIGLRWEYRRFGFIWLDRDGDAQFTLEWEHGESEEFDFADVMASGSHSWGDRCETAWTSWKTLMRDVLDPAEGQTYKRAQGQRPASLLN